MLKKIFKDLISVLLISFISFAFVSCEGIFNSLNLADTNSEINFITKDGKIRLFINKCERKSYINLRNIRK